MDDEAKVEETPKFPSLRTTGAEILAAPWREAVGKAGDEGIDGYSSVLFSAATEAWERGAEADAKALILLGAASSMYYDPKDEVTPLKPAIVFPDRRSAAVEDFDGSHLQAIGEILLEIDNVELQARLGDILWLRKRDHKAAAIAVERYLERADATIDPEHWTSGFRRLQRGTRLAAALGKNHLLHARAIEMGKDWLDRVKGVAPSHLTAALLDLLYEQSALKPIEAADYARAAALVAEGTGDWMQAGQYRAQVAGFLARTKNRAAWREEKRRVGENYLQISESMAGNPALASEHWLERSIRAFKEAGDEDRVNELKLKLQKTQRGGLGHLSTHRHETPIPQELINHLDRARGLSWNEAVAFWAIQARLQSRETLLDQLRMQRESSPLASLFPMILLAEGGRTQVILPPLSGEELSPKDTDNYLWHLAVQTQGLTAWMCEYVRRILIEEHVLDADAFDWLLMDHPWVPEDHRGIFSRGLRAAAEGDTLVSTHLLIPQVENTIRTAIWQAGESTLVMGPDGTQHEQTLGNLLGTEFAETVFGSDFAFTLRGLLGEKAGSNLRNDTAHGLLPEGAFRGPAAVLLAPTILQLLLFGLQSVYSATTESGADIPTQ